MHRIKNPEYVIIGHLNYFRNKFAAVEELITDQKDFYRISKTKTDESFPNHQFKVNSYKII